MQPTLRFRSNVDVGLFLVVVVDRLFVVEIFVQFMLGV